MDDYKYYSTPPQLNFFGRRHPVGLLIITAPAFMVSLYFGYILVSSLIDYMAHATAGEWISALPGMLFVLALFALALSVFAYSASRHNIIVDTRLGVIGKRRELMGLHTRGKVINLAKISKIICRQKSEKITARPGEYNPATTYYHVDLLTQEGQRLPLVNFKDKNKAQRLARKIAGFANIELNDRL